MVKDHIGNMLNLNPLGMCDFDNKFSLDSLISIINEEIA